MPARDKICERCGSDFRGNSNWTICTRCSMLDLIITPACTPDLTEQREVVQHIRDLFNLAPLLEKGFDEELRLLIKKLKGLGWGDKQISDMITYAGTWTRYEFMKDDDGEPLLPRPLPSRGDQAEWRQLKKRAR